MLLVEHDNPLEAPERLEERRSRFALTCKRKRQFYLLSRRQFLAFHCKYFVVTFAYYLVYRSVSAFAYQFHSLKSLSFQFGLPEKFFILWHHVRELDVSNKLRVVPLTMIQKHSKVWHETMKSTGGVPIEGTLKI